jgi:hypothetical protein
LKRGMAYASLQCTISIVKMPALLHILQRYSSCGDTQDRDKKKKAERNLRSAFFAALLG